MPLPGVGGNHPEAAPIQFGWWTRVQFCFWLACGLWVRPRVMWLARSLALY
jgi:hypothetical protein